MCLAGLTAIWRWRSCEVGSGRDQLLASCNYSTRRDLNFQTQTILQKLQFSGHFWYTIWRDDKKLWAFGESVVAPAYFFSLPWIQLYNSWSRVQVSLDSHKWFLWVLEREIIVLMSWGIAGAQKWECDREAIIDNDKAISLRCSVFLRKITMCAATWEDSGTWTSENSNRCRDWIRIKEFICKEASLKSDKACDGRQQI